MTAHRRGPLFARFQETSKYILKIIFYFSFYNSSKLQNARLMFYYFLFVRLSGHKGKNICFFVLILHYLWRFVTLELGYAEKMMMHICFTSWRLTVSLISLSLKRHLQFHSFVVFFFYVIQGPLLSLPWCALLLCHSLHFNLSWLSLWHSTEKDLTAILS